MSYQEQILESLEWVLWRFGASILGLLLIGALLLNLTTWGKQFWRIARTFFNPRLSGWKPYLLFGSILFLSLLGVRISVMFSEWYNGMYTALQESHEEQFWVLMWVFAALAGVHIVNLLSQYYLEQYFTIVWRVQLNDKLLSNWFKHQNYYRMNYLPYRVDNPDQRIQQDVVSFVATSLDLTTGLISSLVSMVAYTMILWNLSGPFTGTIASWTFTIPHGMVFALFVYALLATVFAFKIGKPLIRLNFLSERFNANYRYSLIRVREYAESIAFYGGESVEQHALRDRFDAVIGNTWRIVHRNLIFQGFNFIVSQVAVVFPFILQAGRFFSKQISLGAMVQTAQSFGTLHSNISFFRNAYDSFAAYKAVLDRLTQFLDAVDEAQNLPRPEVAVGATQLKSLSVFAPDGRLLIRDLNMMIPAGQAILLKGASGSGKTTLLRTLAKLWPYSTGEVVLPDEMTLFLSQKPYLPEGTLLQALYYPKFAPKELDPYVEQVLEALSLSHLKTKLQESSNWMLSLSLGEQQRIAIARMLLLKPRLAFIDEATSAMDEKLEENVYRLIRQSLPELTLFSVGHRSTLEVHHDVILQLKTETSGDWELIHQR